MPKKLELVRETYSRHEAFRDFLGEVLEDSIEFTEEELKLYDIPDDLKKGLSETQIIKIANYYESKIEKIRKKTPSALSFYDMMLQYTEKVEKFGIETEKFDKEIQSLKEMFEKAISKAEIAESMTEAFKAIEPLEFKTKLNNSGVSLYFTHPRFDPGLEEDSPSFLKWGRLDGKKTAIRKPDNLVAEIIKQIDSAKESIAFNVYDNNLEVITDAMIRACQRGVKVTGGFSQDVMSHFEPVKLLFNKLISAKCKNGGSTNIFEVDSVGLNHQKILVIDAENPKNAKVVLSSANYTKSGMHPQGDIGPYLDAGGKLYNKEGELLSKAEIAKVMEKAVPNANHAIVLKSPEIAAVVRHQLHYTLEMGLRGTEYPITGTYKFLDSRSGREFYMTFAPQGGLDNINKNFFGDMLRKSDTGEFTITMFAQSSGDFSDQLLIALEKFQKEGDEVKLRVVSDGPFALRNWSEILTMVGYKADVDEITGLVTYREDPHNWKKTLGEETIERFRKSIYIGSRKYGPTTTVYGMIDGKLEHMDIASKIHHKSPTAGNLYVTLASSFNISDGAESNNEIVTYMKDEELTTMFKNANAYLAFESEEDGRLLVNAIQERNLRNKAANKKVRVLIDELVELLKKEKNNDIIAKKLREIERIIDKKKTYRLVMQLGDDIANKQDIGQIIHFIFKFEDNIIDLTKDKFNAVEISKMIEKERFQFKGVGWNELEWALKSSRSSKEVKFVTKMDPDEVYLIFQVLKETGILKNIPKKKNIIKYSKRADLEKIVDNHFEEVNNKGTRNYVDITSGDSKSQAKLHLAAYSDSNEKDLKFVTKHLSDEMAKGRFEQTKFAAFYNDPARPETWSYNQVLYVEDGKGATREMKSAEILEWKKNIFRSCAQYTTPLTQ